MTRSLPAVVSAALLLLVACTQPQPASSSSATAHGPLAMPAADADAPVDLPGLHNVVRYSEDVLSGSVPDGDAGFESLQQLGIRTVISVDGAAPQLDLARRHGLRYVHLPISYDGVPADQAAAMARALHSLEGPFYVHCHHGKHRSAAAAAAASVCTGALSVAQAEQRMQVSGTSANYPGLWAAVASMAPLPEPQLRADPTSFPAIAEVSGMVGTMAELDVVFDNAKVLDESGWQAPATHPDLVAANETARILALFTALRDDPESRALPADYQQQLDAAIDIAGALDAAVQRGDHAAAAAQFAAMGKSCKSCHKRYRDQ